MTTGAKQTFWVQQIILWNILILQNNNLHKIIVIFLDGLDGSV